MDLFGTYSISGEAIVRALSWTFLHSLWQGILLSLVAGAILLLTKKVKPSLRYNLLVISLGLFIVSVFVTFINQLDTNALIVESNLVQTLPINRIEFSENFVMNTVQSSAIIQTTHFINANAIWIVSIWLLVIIIKFIRLSSGFYYIYQLKHNQVSPATEYWNMRITELCKQLKINKKVVLLQSGIVTTPSVIGYFKPVILFPAAILTVLPVHEVEAILIHELGHIRRNDFVVNMLQNIVEVVFFFNPAAKWVSSLIKTERENCCDDIAVSLTGNKKDYIKALINFIQFEHDHSQQFAAAFSGEKNHLLNRAKRIIYNKNNTLNIMEKKFLSASFVLVSICLFSFISMKAQDNKKENEFVQKPIISTEGRMEAAAAVGKQDTIPVYKIGGGRNLTGESNTTIDGREYRLVIYNSIVTHMYIDGKEIPAEKIIDYKTILDKQFAQMSRNQENNLRDHEQAKRESEQAIKESEQAIKESEQAIKESEQAIKESEQAIKESEQAKRDSEQAIKNRERSIKDKEQSATDIEISEKNSANFGFTNPIKPTSREVQPIQPVQPIEPFGFGHGEDYSSRTMNEIIDEVIANNIIKNRKELETLQLNANKLVVNGVTQSKEVHKKFTDKFEVSSSWTWGYNISY